MRVFYATIVGLVVGAVISSVTEYYTGLGQNLLWLCAKIKYGSREQTYCGLATGMISTFPTVLLFAAHFGFVCTCWFYGVALAASAMMATTVQCY
jgi:K(+)-stimulated pyrophosphate-energized sodium pump